MTDTPWTPGPWTLVPKGELANGMQAWMISAADGHSAVWTVDGEADARLIAAAPEMAELLELVDHARDDGELSDWWDDKRQALLSRIRGETDA